MVGQEKKVATIYKNTCIRPEPDEDETAVEFGLQHMLHPFTWPEVANLFVMFSLGVSRNLAPSSNGPDQLAPEVVALSVCTYTQLPQP